MEEINFNINFTEDFERNVPCTSSSLGVVKKVNSQVNIDEKTGKVVSSSASNDCDLSTNIDADDKCMNHKIIKMQGSSSLPDLQQSSTSSPSSTISSNSNNQLQTSGASHGKLVILAVEAQDDESMNQMNGNVGGDDHSNAKQKIKLNIEPSTGSSSSASSSNLEYGNAVNSNL